MNIRYTGVLPYVQAVGAGTISGMRSMSAPTIVATYVSQHAPARQDDSALRHLLTSPPGLAVLHTLALGEMVSDKLPFMPARTATLPLLGRGVLGGLAGASLFIAHCKPPIIGGIVGGTAAIASTYASYHLRRILSEKAHVPDIATGLMEDGIIIGLRKVLFSL
jgi:uncharacterized membrane protein